MRLPDYEVRLQLAVDLLTTLRVENPNARVRTRRRDDREASLDRAQETWPTRVIGVLPEKLDASRYPPRPNVIATVAERGERAREQRAFGAAFRLFETRRDQPRPERIGHRIDAAALGHAGGVRNQCIAPDQRLSRYAGFSTTKRSIANDATAIAPCAPVRAYRNTASRVAPSTSAHVTSAGVAAVLQNKSADSSVDRRGMRFRNSSDSAHAPSDTPRSTRTKAAGRSAASAIDGLSTK